MSKGDMITMNDNIDEIYQKLRQHCFAIVLGWILIQGFLFLSIKKQDYQSSEIVSCRWNGMITLICSLSGVYLLNWLNIIRGSYIYDNIHKILIASVITSFFISFLLFIRGNETRCLKQIHPIIAFFYGTDINFTVAGINLKFFLEFRVSLIGWICFNLCFFLKTMELYTYRRPPAFVLVFIQQIFQGFQLIWNDDTRLQDNEMKRDTIGFLRVFGSLCWFPFLWCLPCQYLTLVNYPIKRLYMIGSVVFFLIGMFIYRSMRNQQEIFAQSRKKNIKSMAYNDGFLSLISSYSSLCQHPFYLGNLLILISWSLPCGSMPIPWILPTYYLLVIYHRIYHEDLISH
ncbi:hypothetical protein I4U23_028420 [Adineta vaga]|nr:hypothetical protein I4U23_028420 [Adineta vaga]